MWADIRRLYRDSAAFALALPILFSIPVILEFAQHVVEIDLGLFDGNRVAASLDQRRLTLGFAKTLALILPGYWFVRYMAWNRDEARAKRVAWPAVGLFAFQFLIQASFQWYALFGPSIATLMSIEGSAANYLSVGTVALATIGGVYLTALFVAWPLGNSSIGPLRSIAIMTGSFWRTIGYTIGGAVPLMAVHYALNYGAMGQPRAIVWAILGLDALVVGFLALTMVGAHYLAARYAAARTGVALLPAAESD
ncbi:hypothetical protein [Sphingomonas sp. TZW2008]|uniref:hypothetical protein n=1 Tax=Sphingomonas sp. TZW2008 TaxID=1917973 RepID=UPI000A269129|nr:hypothetical protein [Sphingomonas sp. TZW2008]